MGNGSAVSRGDRNRNARLERLRVLVPVTNAIVRIDLADTKQMAEVTDHDSKVIARRTFRCARDLGSALDWAAGRAAAAGWAGTNDPVRRDHRTCSHYPQGYLARRNTAEYTERGHAAGTADRAARRP
jgi:hypothetical protein